MFKNNCPLHFSNLTPSPTPQTLSKEEWLASFTGSDRERRLLSRAFDVLQGNTICSPSYPWGDLEVISPWPEISQAGLWGWDTAFHAITVSRYNPKLAKNCINAYTRFQLESGIFPDVIYANGEIVSHVTKPPVLPWASLEVYLRDGDKDFLRLCYERYIKHEAFWFNERRNNGLFYYAHGFESGWDNSVRWDIGIRDLWPIDLHCYLILMYRCLMHMAQVLQDQTHLPLWIEREQWLTDTVEQRFFNPALGAYTDIVASTGLHHSVLSPASFMPLFIGIASPAHAEAMERIAREHFYPGMPTVSYNHPEYSTGYWRGQTWLNVAYFALKGLKQYGFDRTADEMREFLLNMIYNDLDRGISENYDTLKQCGMYHPSFSWSAAFIIEFILNWDT